MTFWMGCITQGDCNIAYESFTQLHFVCSILCRVINCVAVYFYYTACLSLVPHLCVQVLRIERVQNAKLWRRYCLKREELVDARGEAGGRSANVTRVRSHCCKTCEHAHE
jgi:hypothetical protein